MTLTVEQFILTAPHGTMIHGQCRTAEREPWQTCFLIRDYGWRIKGFGPHPDIEMRGGAWYLNRVMAAVVLFQISGELYETWFNYYAEPGVNAFQTLAEQASFVLRFYDDALVRGIRCDNDVRDFFIGLKATAQLLTPWSMAEFDAVRAAICRKYPTPAALWRTLHVFDH